jgi:hypothetical protein
LQAPRRFRDRDKHFHLLKAVAFCGCYGRAMIPNASGKLDPDGKPYRCPLTALFVRAIRIEPRS